jgi:hypothetical protein
MKAETIPVAGEWLKTDDGFLVDLNVEEASVGSYRHVAMATIGTNGGGQYVRVVGEDGTATGTMFGHGHRSSYAVRASFSSA